MKTVITYGGKIARLFDRKLKLCASIRRAIYLLNQTALVYLYHSTLPRITFIESTIYRIVPV